MKSFAPFRLARLGIAQPLPSRLLIRRTLSQSSADTTFVSKHYNVDLVELREVVDKMKTEVRKADNGELCLKVCKLCSKGNKTKADNIWKLRVRKDGSYYCHRCSSGGSWFQLKKQVSLGLGLGLEREMDIFTPADALQGSDSTRVRTSDVAPPPSDSVSAPASSKVLPDQTQALSYMSALFPASGIPVSDDAKRLQHYLFVTRGLTQEVLMKYGCGLAYQKFPDNISGQWTDKLCVSFPWMGARPEGGLVVERLKFRALETKGLQRVLPKGGAWGFFGWHTVRASDEEIIITEGEYDAMAVSQALLEAPAEHPLRSVPAVSLPNGCNSLPVDLVPLLERFRKIYLWLDDDKSGRDGCAKFARKLGINRCYAVRPLEDVERQLVIPEDIAPAASTRYISPKDANDALRQPVPHLIPLMLSAAKLLPNEKVLSFADLRAEAINGLTQTEPEGVHVTSLPHLSSITKGLRRGELVVFTGPTGGGKTTILSQMSLDVARKGVPVLWGSFEIRNSRLVQKMLQQHLAQGDIKLLDRPRLEQLCDDFESLPLRFMNFYGSTDIDEIVAAMDFCVYRDDVQCIVLDNLQFMMPRRGGGSSSGFEKFDLQDAVIDRFRAFATEKNVTIILVIHPRKEDENIPLRMSSIFGTAKATQEADLVLLLQRVGDRTWIDVKKNRFDGALGSVNLGFSGVRSAFYEQADQTLAAPVGGTFAPAHRRSG